MARVRFLGPEPVYVPELGVDRIVQPDEVVTVPDDRYDGYACQPTAWEAVEEPKTPDPAPAPAPAAKKTSAAKTPQKEA
ncbi:hypothetical protein GCM10010387_22370 [Streptomyces inusitatus]|uniref:Uncharacterized protein n=1 Tax=Streptomyces inusitatus TaxID=68221 RepID=A0A918Q2G7_9ACTN|nr:hypothetical protein [Streptomyces inusitatus]GGZ28437.1 hypothetical protein GCM10010387_22370 [Streptomyces inusitatus]